MLKKHKNMTKKIYIIQLGPIGTKIFSESKEEMLKLWELLQGGNFKKLHSEHDWDDNEMFYWPQDLRIELKSNMVYLHEDQEGAKKAKIAHEHAKKVGIISKKKKKT